MSLGETRTRSSEHHAIKVQTAGGATGKCDGMRESYWQLAVQCFTLKCGCIAVSGKSDTTSGCSWFGQHGSF